MEAQELDTISSFELWVPGHPITQGNKTAFPFKGKDGKLHVSMTEGKGSGKLKNWRSTIAGVFAQHYAGAPRGEPVHMTQIFKMKRPQNHYRTNGELKDWAEGLEHIKRPDIEKLARAVNDALSGVLWKDDSQVCELDLRKQYAEDGKVGVFIWGEFVEE